ncbi:translation initiation factor IF-3 [Candidatus Parcubacteria bacterium]|nr:translation initiation factor IF-3 [Candidatus Parcubacteria bacterium]
MRRTWRKAKTTKEKQFLANRQIRAKKVFLIDENGEKLGKVSIEEALQKASDVLMDLVEVNPKGDYPVCKIMDYGQFKYEQEKKSHKQKQQQKKVETKGIRLSVRISQHDVNLRLAQAEKFFAKGHKLKIDLVLKGRERAHPAKAAQVIRDFVATLDKNPDLNIIPEQDLTKQGGRFIMILVNKKSD